MGLLISLLVLFIYLVFGYLIDKIFFKIFENKASHLSIYFVLLFSSIVAAAMMSARVLMLAGIDAEFAGTGFAYLLGMVFCAIALVGRILYLSMNKRVI